MKRGASIALGLLALLTPSCQLLRGSKPAVKEIDYAAQIRAQADAVLDFVEGRTAETPDFSDLLPETGVDTSTIEEAVRQLRERSAVIKALKAAGCLVENNRGRVELWKTALFDDAEEKNTVQKTLSDENKDRKELYREVARSYGAFRVSISDVQRVYVLKRFMRAASGEILQLPKETEDLAVIKAAPIGRRLGETCTAEAWVTIP